MKRNEALEIVKRTNDRTPLYAYIRCDGNSYYT